MASSRLHAPWEDIHMSQIPNVLMINPVPHVIALILFASLVLLVHSSSNTNKFGTANWPILNPKSPYEITATRVKHRYFTDSWNEMQRGIRKFGFQPFRILASDLGDALILPPKYVNVIRNDTRFSFTAAAATQFHGWLPGFQIFKCLNQHNRIVQLIIQTHLNRSLTKLTKPLSKECDLILQELLTDNKDWHDVTAKSVIVQLVARLSTLTFLGEDLCRNKSWIDLTTSFSVQVFVASGKLSSFPPYLQRIANLVLPECRLLRTQLRKATEIVHAELKKRRALKEDIVSRRLPPREFTDMLEWYDIQYQKLGGEYSPALAQMTVSIVAIHTTTDLLTQVILDLAENPELFEPLREEVTTVLNKSGWKKTSLHNMKLLDSVIKESQRLSPTQVGFMLREVLQDATLSDNIHLKQGAHILISPKSMRDPAVHDNPDKYDGYRFVRMRKEPEKENIAQFISTSPEHLAFGHGQHACPGRFFAANEIKITMCHLLVKYDWKLAEGSAKPQRRVFGNNTDSDALAKVAFRRREESFEWM